MADFFPVTERKISFSDKFEPAPSVPNNTHNKAAMPGDLSKVGATGDSVPSNSNNKVSMSGDLSKVGATGDNAAKKGTGK